MMVTWKTGQEWKWKWRDITVFWIHLKAEQREETNERDVGSKKEAIRKIPRLLVIDVNTGEM